MSKIDVDFFYVSLSSKVGLALRGSRQDQQPRSADHLCEELLGFYEDML
jgi:hypothetical protein